MDNRKTLSIIHGLTLVGALLGDLERKAVLIKSPALIE